MKFFPFVILIVSLFYTSAHATLIVDNKPLAWKTIFPEANTISEYTGEPATATVYHDKKVLGYLFHTIQIFPIPAYSGKPMDMLVGIDIKGDIVGIKVIEHHEPILLVGIPESTLTTFVDQYIGKRVDDHIKVGAGQQSDSINVDAISGATVTVMVMNRAIMSSARKVAIAKGIIAAPSVSTLSSATVRMNHDREIDWDALIEAGAIHRMLLNRGEVDDSFANTAAAEVDKAGWGEGRDTFIDLYYTYLNIPTIGKNLLGDAQYNHLMSELKPGEHAIALLANGIYSYRGSGFVRGGIFDRILLRQGDDEISFRDMDYLRLNDVYAQGMPTFSEKAVFIIRPTNTFDPTEEWNLELLVKRQTGPLDSVFSSFAGKYKIPDEYLLLPSRIVDENEPIWRAVWRERSFQIAILVAGLSVLTFIMMFQDWLVGFPRALVYLRNGFLLYTVFFIGWYLLGQLSIVNVFTFTTSITTHNFSWDTFLIDPTMFILWAFVAVILVMWGRGVYCGWLCPFGAIQTLVNELARKFKVPQFEFPQIIHDRLWGIKYLILMAMFGVSLESLATAERYAEIEPFKTAITLRFDRELPFVLYALGLIAISVFNSKFYCKYICPLGAALAVPAKLSLVNWLRRRRECGNPCQICAAECEIQAISSRGEIQINECHYCLDCQVTYWDEHRCPPLVKRNKQLNDAAARKREKGQTSAVETVIKKM
ncbi:MAG: NosR/NirI family protein [Gammaproteobacteria bacterium]|nr:NosR/NirI family protein [Gammaproteobacteria bacterium]